MSISRQVRRHQERMARKGKILAPGTPVRADYGRVTKSVKPGTGRYPDPKVERLVECALIDAEGVTHHGFRSHSDLRASLGREDPYRANPTDEYGFWTSRGRFVDRRAGNIIAAEAGQCQRMQREMLSSDIDW